MTKVRHRKINAIAKEGLVGFINGCLFACLVGVIAALWFHNETLGAVIHIAPGEYRIGMGVLALRVGFETHADRASLRIMSIAAAA